MPEEMVPFAGLATADLVLDRVYAGGTRGLAGDDAIGKLLPATRGGLSVPVWAGGSSGALVGGRPSSPTTSPRRHGTSTGFF